jgi:hypothetical protein
MGFACFAKVEVPRARSCSRGWRHDYQVYSCDLDVIVAVDVDVESEGCANAALEGQW